MVNVSHKERYRKHLQIGEDYCKLNADEDDRESDSVADLSFVGKGWPAKNGFHSSLGEGFCQE